MVLGVVQGYPLRQMRVGSGEPAQLGQRRPHRTVCHHEHGRVLRVLRQRHELLTQGMRRLKLSAHESIIPQAIQHGEKLVRLVQSLTELPRMRVGLFYLRSPITFGGKQRCPQSDQHIHFALETFSGLGERLEQLQPLTKMGDRFDMG